MTAKDSSLERTAALRPDPSPAIVRFLRVKGTSLAMRAMNTWARALHRLRPGPRLLGLDHLTIPCHDLAVAEAFYTGVLGARVLLRIDEEFLRKVGRAKDADAGAIHTSVVFGEGARLDLFVQANGQPPLMAGHPHYAFAVSPRALLRWKRRLEDAGIPTYGPTRLGPPGQASLYFNDPSGNHLEIVTRGFLPDIPIGPPDMAALEHTWRPS